MKSLLYIVCLIPTVSFSQMQTVEFRGEKHFVYPVRYREPSGCHNNFTFNEKVPDGKYIVYSEEDTTKVNRIFEIHDFKIKQATVFRENNSFEVISLSDSVWKEYDSKGRIYEESYMSNGEFVIVSLWDTLGNKMVSDGNGKFVLYYENGNKVSEGEILNGKHNNYYRFWYENGQIQSEGNYKYGKKIGVWKYYGENGEEYKPENNSNE